ncbi:WBC30 protein, partial [Malurus elegans]|nr:WBC30 protein [Malurus elegans]
PQVTGPCLAGFYCTGGALSPSPRDGVVGNSCPQGSYCPQGSASPLPCPAGRYSSSTGSTGIQDCPLCDAGKTLGNTEGWDFSLFQGSCHYCPRHTERATQHPCPTGTYSGALNLKNASQCQLCPPGRVCSRPGLARPDGLCTPGWFCPPGSTSSKPHVHGVAKPLQCPAGHYCPPGTRAANQYPCPEGTYSNQSGLENSRDCRPCPGGTFCARAGG